MNLIFILSIILWVRYYQLTKLGWKSFTKNVTFLVLDFLIWQSIWFTQHWFLVQELIQVRNRNIILDLFRPEIVMLWEYETTFIQISNLYNFKLLNKYIFVSWHLNVRKLLVNNRLLLHKKKSITYIFLKFKCQTVLVNNRDNVNVIKR